MQENKSNFKLETNTVGKKSGLKEVILILLIDEFGQGLSTTLHLSLLINLPSGPQGNIPTSALNLILQPGILASLPI